MTSKSVYFIRQIGGIGNIKIGCSHSTRRRLEQLAAWSPTQLEVLVSVEGDGTLERKIQECFLDSLSHHEWFKPTPALLALIDKLKAGIPVEQAIDLSAMRQGSISAKQRAWEINPDARLRCSYTHRLGWYERKLGRELPSDVRATFKRWYRGHVNDDKPSAAEFRRIEDVLAEVSGRTARRSEAA